MAKVIYQNLKRRQNKNENVPETVFPIILSHFYICSDPQQKFKQFAPHFITNVHFLDYTCLSERTHSLLST